MIAVRPIDSSANQSCIRLLHTLFIDIENVQSRQRYLLVEPGRLFSEEGDLVICVLDHGLGGFP